MSNHDYDEQRNYVRMSVKTQVTYKVKNSDGRTHHGISGDLSASGLYMHTGFELKEGDEIELMMTPNGDRLPPFIAEGKVVRMTVDQKDIYKFHVSVELTKIS